MCQMHTLGAELQEVALWKVFPQTAIDFCQGRLNFTGSYYPNLLLIQSRAKKIGETQM